MAFPAEEPADNIHGIAIVLESVPLLHLPTLMSPFYPNFPRAAVVDGHFADVIFVNLRAVFFVHFREGSYTQRIHTIHSPPCLAHPPRGLSDAIFFQIPSAPKSFSRLEVGKGVSHEVRLLIHPYCHILLPLWYIVSWILRVAVWLGIRIYITPLVGGPGLLRTLPPVVYAIVALPKVIPSSNHRVEKVLPRESVGIDERHGSLTFCYLAVGVAAEPDTAVV